MGARNLIPSDENDDSTEDEKTNKLNDRILALMMAEHKALKDEVKNIKKCQTTYFWSSITVSGLLLTFSVEKNEPLVLILVLLIVSPMWCLYFDKTSLMIRIIAYIRVLERSIINFDRGKNTFCGFENYTKLYKMYVFELYKQRSKDKSEISFFISRMKKMIATAFFRDPTKEAPKNESGFDKVISFRMPNQKIYLIWWQYFFISLMCFVLILFEAKLILVLISIPIFMFSVTYTLYLVRELVDGNNRSTSYREDQCLELIGITEENKDKLQNFIKNLADKELAN